jgi:hypothetical protein
MASVKIYTRQDKAAFLNHLDKSNIKINSNDIEDVEKDETNQSYFIVNNIDDETASKIRDAFKNNNNIKVQKLNELLNKIICEELEKKLGSAK